MKDFLTEFIIKDAEMFFRIPKKVLNYSKSSLINILTDKETSYTEKQKLIKILDEITL